MKLAIHIHEKVNGFKCQALFIFNNSSAYATLPPDVLHAFGMNKANGNKQHKQCDTIILQSNLDSFKCGQLQKMTTLSGESKGLQAVLEG